MKKILLSIIAILLTILFILIFFIRGIPELNTEYTKEFSYQKFSKVKEGMKKEQVKQILGDPFEMWEPGNECWRYSRGARKFKVEPGTLSGIIFDGWISVQVCFKDNRVIDTPLNKF